MLSQRLVATTLVSAGMMSTIAGVASEIQIGILKRRHLSMTHDAVTTKHEWKKDGNDA
jgi:hypothetical protein